MPDTRTLPPTPATPATIERRSTLAYLLLVLLLPVLLASTAFFVVIRPSYERWSASRWGPELEYPFNMPRQDADVVIFGDSSAFLGIDPRVVDAQLGIRSVVMPATIGSLPVIGDRTLELYLAHNTRPRLIVFYFAAWNLDYRRTAKSGLFEGEELLLRHMTLHDLAAYARWHPGELMKFPFRFYNTFSMDHLPDAANHAKRQEAVAEALGHADYNEPIPPLQTPCTLPKEDLTDTATGSVQDLLRRYRQTAIPVMVFLAPIPGCTNASIVLGRSYAAVAAAPPRVLPPGDFAADPYYAHIRPASVPKASSLFAEALRPRLRQGAPR